MSDSIYTQEEFDRDWEAYNANPANHIRALRHAVQYGNTRTVAYLLKSDIFKTKPVVEDAHAQAIILEVDSWLKGALDFESIHGPGSMLVRDHPFNVKMERFR